MANKRRNYSEAEHVLLLAQVGGACPLCGQLLHYQKGSRLFKGYELAHIYPLNPKPSELLRLEGVERLSEDVNHPDNMIPLCETCHGRFDKPRTRAEYEMLADRKRKLLRRTAQQRLQVEFPIDEGLIEVLLQLQDPSVDPGGVTLSYEAQALDEKLNPDVPRHLRRKVQHCVLDYYSEVNRLLKELERENPSSSDLICTQVKAFYLKQKSLGLPKEEVFENVVNWVLSKTKDGSLEVGEAVTSYFVQHCEVFE